MTYKELKAKYKGYDVIAFGKPLDTPTIPFTHLPKDKPLDECEVVEFKADDKKFIQTGVSFKDLKPLKPIKKKGHVYAYVK